MQIDAVIFDLFGTLVDMFSIESHRRVLSEMASILSLPPEDVVRQWDGTFQQRHTGAFPDTETNIEHICLALGSTVAEEKVREAARIRNEFTRKSMSPRPDAVETLVRLRERALDIGLISDSSPEVPRLWSENPLAPLVDVPVFSCEVRLKKPDPRIYALACDRLGVDPESCLYVGDGSSRELTGASRVGMRAVLLRVPYEDTDEIFRPDEDDWTGALIRSLSDVPDLVDISESDSMK